MKYMSKKRVYLINYIKNIKNKKIHVKNILGKFSVKITFPGN